MTRKNLYIFSLVLSVAGYALIAWDVIDSRHGPTVCLFKTVIDLPCPSCGTTRSIAALAAGDVYQAMAINPFGVMSAFALIVIPLWIAADVLRKKDTFYHSYLAVERHVARKPWLSFLAVLIVVANWLWNVSKAL
ncbi:MAG: DUF2752 domain-containing protein [Ignavibacteriales bacterium]|nr:DUF2752 domain-containing protein [Ignavibacteriales bacterium]